MSVSSCFADVSKNFLSYIVPVVDERIRKSDHTFFDHSFSLILMPYIDVPIAQDIVLNRIRYYSK